MPLLAQRNEYLNLIDLKLQSWTLERTNRLQPLFGGYHYSAIRSPACFVPMDTSAANNGEEPQPQPQPQSLSLLLDISQGDRGILCNDTSGLCLASQGNISTENAGVFTNLVRLAAQLPESSSGSSSQNGSSAVAAPVITIEYDSFAYIVKEYDGHAVAARVPRIQSQSIPSGGLQGANSNDSVDQSA